MNNSLKGNLAMAASKTFAGLNENALRYLMQHWMSAWSGVVFRLGAGALIFWIAGLFRKPAVRPTRKQKLLLLATGAVLMYGYMLFLLLGLKYTTPVSSAIFISMEPVCVFVLCVVFFRERVTAMKVLGIGLGLAGALMCVFTDRHSSVASDPLLGDLYCAIGTLFYSVYLVVCSRFLTGLDNLSVSKWTFLGGTISTLVGICFTGWDAPVLEQGLFSTPMLVLLFVVLFPTALGYFLLYMGLRYLSATVVALYGYLILVIATVASYILGQDRFSWFQIVAIVLMVASVYFVEVAEKRPAAASKPHPEH